MATAGLGLDPLNLLYCIGYLEDELIFNMADERFEVLLTHHIFCNCTGFLVDGLIFSMGDERFNVLTSGEKTF